MSVNEAKNLGNAALDRKTEQFEVEEMSTRNTETEPLVKCSGCFFLPVLSTTAAGQVVLQCNDQRCRVMCGHIAVGDTAREATKQWNEIVGAP